jgi:xanthine dehydrogenase accessory factor
MAKVWTRIRQTIDFDITAAALQRDAFDFVGLIGSETKRARFASWARQVGVAESRIDWLVCPIGMPQIRGKEPAVIAAGIAAQLLIARERASAPLVSPATQPA